MSITVNTPAQQISSAVISAIMLYADDLPEHKKTGLNRLRKKPLKITVEERTPKHTSEQQALYWATLREWGRNLGYTGKETERYLHEEVLIEAWGENKDKRKGRIPIPNKRSSELDVADYSFLITVMERMRAEYEGA